MVQETGLQVVPFLAMRMIINHTYDRIQEKLYCLTDGLMLLVKMVPIPLLWYSGMQDYPTNSPDNLTNINTVFGQLSQIRYLAKLI